MSAVRAAPAAVRSPPVTCPYRGLLPFSEDEARYFFGRDADREIITANLIAARLTLFYAPSGVGKTSVLLAGVAHDLRALARDGALDGHGPEYLPVVVRRWSGDPIAAIDAALVESAERVQGGAPEPPPTGERLVDRLREWATATDTTLLLVLDQFEEFVLYHGSSWEPGGAARELAQALSARDLPANFLLGLREDALASLDRFKGRVPYLFDNYLRLAHLDVDAAREAVLRPLEQWSRDHPDDPMEIEPALVDTLLDEVTAGRITLGRAGRGIVEANGRQDVEAPFLQLVLTRLWEHERAHGSRCMRASTLRALGGAAELVQTHLDVRMSDLTASQRDVAAAVFHQLVTPSGTKVARSLDDLAAYTDLPPQKIEPVLRTLSHGDWRIVRSVTEPADGGHGTYEVFHDVLAEAVLDWRARHEEQRRRARTLRKAAVVGLCAALVTGLALLFAAWVQQQKEEAERQSDRATSRELAASAQLRFGIDPERAVATAVSAVRTAETAEAMRALRGALAQNDLRGTLQGARGAVRSLRLSLDGRRLAVAGQDHRVRIWTLAEPGRHVTLPAAAGSVESVALSTDGDRVAVAGEGGRITVWNVDGPRLLRRLAYPGAQPQSIRWSPRGDRLLAFGDGGVRVWDAATGRLVKHLPSGRLGEWSGGGTRFATATGGGAVDVWSAGGRHLRSLAGRGRVQTLGFTGDGSRVVAVRHDASVSILGARGCRARGAPVTVATVARDGRHVALGGGPSVRILDVGPGERCRQVELPNPQQVNAVALALSPDGSVAVVANDDGIARVYDIRKRTQLATLFAGWREKARLSMREGAGGGQLIFTAGDDGLVRQWQVGALPLAGRFGTARVKAAAIRPDGRLVGAVGERLLATRWEAAGDAVRIASAPGMDAAVLDRRGARLAYTTRRGDLLVLDSGGERRQVGGGGAGRDVSGLAFSPDGRRLVTALESGAVEIWDAASGARVQRIPPPRGTIGHAFATFAGGSAVAVADRGVRLYAPGATAPRRIVRIGRVAPAAVGGTPVAAAPSGGLVVALDHASPLSLPQLRGAQPIPLDRAGRLVSAVAFSPGGEVLATAGRNGLRLLDAASGQALAVLSAGSLDRVAFSVDGRWIVATDSRRGAHVFPCRPCGGRDELLQRVDAMRALVPVSPLEPARDGALVSPPPEPGAEPPAEVSPQASAPLQEAAVVARPVEPSAAAPVPAPTGLVPIIGDSGPGGGSDDPITAGGGED